MSHFIYALRVNTLKKKLERYKREKENSIRIQRGEKTVYKFGDEISHWRSRTRRGISYLCSRIFFYHPNSFLSKFCHKLRTDGTFENYIAKSILGFVGGIVLTYIVFMFLVFQLNFKDAFATKVCSVLGIILTLGLAFSFKVRCITFLILPQFFSKRGRQALMAYAFILALTGPGKNMLHNTQVLSESMACGQEQVRSAVRQNVDAIKRPFLAIRDAIRVVMKEIKKIALKVKDILLGIKRVIMVLVGVITTAARWLASIFNICNKKVGTPFDRCMKAFDDAVSDCKATLGPFFRWLCSIAYITSAVCYVLKILDLICMLIDIVVDAVVGPVKRKLKEFLRHLHNIFYVSVEFQHSFQFETNQSRSYEEISEGIIMEIKQRTAKYLVMMDWMSLFTSFIFIFMLLKALHFQRKYLSSDQFENCYITDDFYKLDMQRAQMHKETVLPLNKREKRRYIKIRSCMLVKKEKIKLAKSAVGLCMTTLKLGIHLMADYCLYWVLDIIRFHGSVQSKLVAPNMVGVHVDGEGILADLFRSVVNAFQPLGIKMDVDTVPCLPHPRRPNYGRYIHIMSLAAVCMILTIAEPFGLRLRHRFMGVYHPDRARIRAVWLYNHILRSRGSFLKFARRQLRMKFVKGGVGIEKVTLMERLRAVCPLLNRIMTFLGSSSPKACLMCGTVARPDDKHKLVNCRKPDCVGLYCVECFADLRNVCTLCMDPLEYGDLSDVSLEKDSSEEEGDIQKKRKKPSILLTQSYIGNKPPSDKLTSSDSDDYQTLLKNDMNNSTFTKGGTCNKDNYLSQQSLQDPSLSSTSSSSHYSYQYREEYLTPNPQDSLMRLPFKDIEAQNVMDHATLQEFDEPSDFQPPLQVGEKLFHDDTPKVQQNIQWQDHPSVKKDKKEIKQIKEKEKKKRKIRGRSDNKSSNFVKNIKKIFKHDKQTDNQQNQENQHLIDKNRLSDEYSDSNATLSDSSTISSDGPYHPSTTRSSSVTSSLSSLPSSFLPQMTQANKNEINEPYPDTSAYKTPSPLTTYRTDTEHTSDSDTDISSSPLMSFRYKPPGTIWTKNLEPTKGTSPMLRQEIQNNISLTSIHKHELPPLVEPPVIKSYHFTFPKSIYYVQSETEGFQNISVKDKEIGKDLSSNIPKQDSQRDQMRMLLPAEQYKTSAPYQRTLDLPLNQKWKQKSTSGISQSPSPRYDIASSSMRSTPQSQVRNKMVTSPMGESITSSISDTTLRESSEPREYGAPFPLMQTQPSMYKDSSTMGESTTLSTSDITVLRMSQSPREYDIPSSSMCNTSESMSHLPMKIVRNNNQVLPSPADSERESSTSLCLYPIATYPLNMKHTLWKPTTNNSVTSLRFHAPSPYKSLPRVGLKIIPRASLTIPVLDPISTPILPDNYSSLQQFQTMVEKLSNSKIPQKHSKMRKTRRIKKTWSSKDYTTDQTSRQRFLKQSSDEDSDDEA